MRSLRAALLVLVFLAPAVAASAQTPYEHVSLDTTIAFDMFRGENVSDRPQVIVDIIGTVQLGERWQIYVRPWFRLPRPSPPTAPPPAWDTQLYQASLRYERPGPIATRVDAGYMASPVGLGLFDANPRINPTIAGHSSYFTPMLPFDAGGPRGPAIASTYPLGAVLTLSATRWDARAAVVNSAPVRGWVLGGATNPSPTPVFEAGAGVTPTTGLRLGVSFAHGAFLRGRGTQPDAGARRSPGDARRVRRRLCRAVYEADGRVRSRQLHDPRTGRERLRVVHPGHADDQPALVDRRTSGRHLGAGRRNRRRVPRPAAACWPAKSPPATAPRATSR